MILVTGGTGFLGAVLVKSLIDAGKSVIATKRSNSQIPEVLKSSSLIQWVSADTTDYFALYDVFSCVTQVFHCAAMISHDPKDVKSMMHTNVEGTTHIVNLCMEFGARLLHVSSIAALGPNKFGVELNEEAKWEFTSTTSPYAMAKHKSEMVVWRGMMEGLDVVIVNPSVIMGRGINEGKVAANAIFDQVNEGLKFYPPGSVGIVDVWDVAQIMILLMDSDIRAERFILNSENISNRELLVKVSAFFGRPAPRIKAGKILLSIAWRAAKIGAIFSGKRPVLTKQTARAASEVLRYDAGKIRITLGYTFKGIDEILKEVYTTYYHKNNQNSEELLHH